MSENVIMLSQLNVVSPGHKLITEVFLQARFSHVPG